MKNIPPIHDHAFRTVALLLAVCIFLPSGLSRAAEQKLSEHDQNRIKEALRDKEAQYDPEAQMIRRPFSSPGYHTTLKGGDVHPTRDSLNYAVALLDTGDPDLQKRAEAILRKVIRLQDQDPKSKTYGIWSWFLEETLDKMSPPDWNWADFCGVQLLQVARDHRHRLPADLAEQVDDAIRHAARSIQRRNVGPGYTNIALMGTYVTLIAAELYGIEDLHTYALQRLQRFAAYTREQGAFTEYNSPTYTVVALKEIGRLRLHAKDPEAKRLAEELYRVAWEEIAHHFHPPTRQWAGPHSRCYSTLLSESVLGLIQRATEGRVRFFPNDPPGAPDDLRLPLPCPRDLESFFTQLDSPRELVKTFVKGNPPIVGTTFLGPDFALGSINRGDLWNQRRALIACWGSAERPAYLHLRFLHDGYDFAAAQFFSAQKGGLVLAGINFATDGGDTHVSLDRIKNGAIRARDLRLRFELGGAAGLIQPEITGTLTEPKTLQLGTLRVHLAVPYARWGEREGRLETGMDPIKKTAGLDVVMYSGEEREFRLNALEQAVIGLGVMLSSDTQPLPKLSAEVREGRLHLETQSPELKLSLPVKPGKASELQKQAF